MTPSSNKTFIENESRLEHGKRIVPSNPRIDSRNLTLQINLTASDEKQFFERYNAFCEELAAGVLEIETKYQPDVAYKTIYQSCSQFSQFMRGIGKFTLKLIEPNPNDRTATVW
nr:MAG TPA: tail protein [Caudoviricetes sp.]